MPSRSAFAMDLITMLFRNGYDSDMFATSDDGKTVHLRVWGNDGIVHHIAITEEAPKHHEQETT